MAVDLLDAPLRISWDLCPTGAPALEGEKLLQVAQQLTAAGIFFVSLEESPLSHPSIQELLEQLCKGGCQVALITNGSASELDRLAQLPEDFALFVDVGPFTESGQLDKTSLADVFSLIRQRQKDPALLWTPRHGELALLPELLEFCSCQKISRFKLPNQKISANSENSTTEYLPDCTDLIDLQTLIKTKGLPEVVELQLEVHDLFFWELLQPLTGGQRSEYGGCQAANSLGHISVGAELLPCSSWPESLGNLLEADLQDLWQSAKRLQIREEIARTPEGCDGCRDYQICFGGCRGLSRFCRDDELGRDLLCRDRR